MAHQPRSGNNLKRTNKSFAKGHNLFIPTFILLELKLCCSLGSFSILHISIDVESNLACIQYTLHRILFNVFFLSRVSIKETPMYVHVHVQY